MLNRPITRVLPAIVMLTMAAACSKSTGVSPVAPSPTSSSTAPVPGAGAMISGTVVGSGSPSGLVGGPSARAVRGDAGASQSLVGGRPLSVVTGGPLTISVVGTAITTTTDGDGRFTLQNVPAGNPTISISGNGVSAEVPIPSVGENQQIFVTLVVSGGTATMDDTQRVSPGNQTEVEGQIVSVTGNTIVVGRQNTSIVVPAGVPITQEGVAKTFAALTVGTRVEVQGTRTGTDIVATAVRIEKNSSSEGESGTPGGPGGGSSGGTSGGGSGGENSGGGARKELSGVVAAAPTGVCPVITFTVGLTTVKTSASTKFDNVNCGAVAKGDVVAIEGTQQSDGSVLATKLVKTNGVDGKEVEFSGVVASAPVGTCPSITLTVGTTVVKTGPSTKFDKTPCSAIAKGDKVSGEGRSQNDGSVLAGEIEDERESEGNGNDNNQVTFNGTLTAPPTGSCPTIAFTVGAQKITTNGTTKFLQTACAGISSGTKVSGKGTVQPNGSVLASQVEKVGSGGGDSNKD